MKFGRIHEVYWVEAMTSATSVMENVTPTTVVIGPAIVDYITRAPSGLAPNRRGQRATHWPIPVEYASTRIIARAMLAATISEGTNQKFVHSSFQNV